MNRRCFAAFFILLAALLSSCRSPAAPVNKLVYGLTLAPSGIDPHLNASAELGIPLSSVYDTLVFRDQESGRFVPGLAESWTISDDGLKYTFYLRSDIQFHDGTAFDAQAVKANIEYVLNPENHSQKAASMLGPLQQVVVEDDQTVTLLLSEPFAPLLDSLSQVYLGMASPVALETWGPGEFQFHQVGTGPYRFDGYVPNDHLTLRANRSYALQPSIYEHSQPSIETIEFRFFVSEATRSIALESGAAQIVGEIPQHDAERLASGERFKVQPVAIPGQPTQFLFNLTHEPTDNRNVRRALIMAVDRQSITSTVFGAQSPTAVGALSMAGFGIRPDEALPAYDPAAAERLLEAEGWSREVPNGIRERDGQPFELTIVSPDWGSNPQVAQLIKTYWEAVGARVRLQVMPGFGQLKEAQASGDYSAIGINFFGTDANLLRSFYHSDGFYNWGHAENDELDALLDQAAAMPADDAQRAASYRRALNIINREALVLPIRDYVNLVVFDGRVEGLHFSAQGWFPALIDLTWAP